MKVHIRNNKKTAGMSQDDNDDDDKNSDILTKTGMGQKPSLNWQATP